VRQNFNLEKFDYILGFGIAILMIIILATVAFSFVQRLYEIMLLYICAPFFVSSMPLDDGQKYGAWRDMFIAKLVSGMGTIVLVNLFLMVVPVIMDDSLRLDPRAEALVPSNMIYNYLLKVVFVVGGAFAIKQGGSIITGIVNYQAGMQESQTMQQVGASVTRAAAFTGGAALTAGKGLFKAAAAPVKLGGTLATRKVQKELTKKMLSGGDNPSLTTSFLRGAYKKGTQLTSGVRQVQDTARRVTAFAKGDFAGAQKVNGQDTYHSRRTEAYMKGNMIEFLRMDSAEGQKAGGAEDRKAETDRRQADYFAARPWKQSGSSGGQASNSKPAEKTAVKPADKPDKPDNKEFRG
jgi:hypothetical protein